MGNIETQNAIPKEEHKNPEIALNSLETRTLNSFPCIANDDWSFTLMYNNQAFDFEFNDEKMCFEVAEKTKTVLDYSEKYLPKKTSFEYNQNLFREDGISVKWRSFFPVNLVYASTFEKILWTNPDNFLEQYAAFLTAVNQKRQDIYDNKFDIAKTNSLTKEKNEYFMQLLGTIDEKKPESFMQAFKKITQLPKAERKAQELAMIQYISEKWFKVSYGFSLSDLRMLTDNFSEITFNNSTINAWDKISFQESNQNSFDVMVNWRKFWSLELRSHTDKLVLNTIQNFNTTNSMMATTD